MRNFVRFSVLLSLAILAAPASAQEQIIRLEPDGERLSESAAGWREVRRWSGSADRTTPLFAVLGQNWRIRWQVSNPPGYQPQLFVWVHEAGQPTSRRAVVQRDGPGHGVAQLWNGPGEFALEIVASNADWLLIVEESTRDEEIYGSPYESETTLACLGSPARDGEGTLGGGATFGDDAIAYSMGFSYNTRSPVAFGFGASFADVEDVENDVFGVSGGMAFKAITSPASLCPAFGVGYSRIEDIDIDIWTVPIGLGVGFAVDTGTGLRVIPHVEPDFLLIHLRGFGESETETEFGLSAGITFAGDWGFGDFGFSVTTIDDSDPTFGVGAGFIF